MAHGLDAMFECPKCPYVASNEAQLRHHMVNNPIHGREIGPKERSYRSKNTQLEERRGDFR